MSTNKVRVDESIASANIADIVTETLANGTQIPVSKIHTGTANIDGGAVTLANPFPVTITNQPSSYDVIGTFWQDEQPVSIAASVAVTGTFWQATQPVILEAGTELIGKVGIDQTTPGTTEAVTVKPTGANAPVSRSTSTAYEAGRLASSSSAVLFGLSGHNSSTSGLFIQIHNSSTVPADTAVPVEIFYVPASSSFAFEAACQAGDTYSNGIYVCCSTTGSTKTIGGAVCWFNVRYR